MPIILNDSLKINAGKPIDNKYLASTNQPYINTAAVISAIPQALRYLGLTANVNNIEYWFYSGVTDGDLIIKNTGGITSACNGLTKVGSTAILGGTLTGNTSISGSYILSICGNAQLNTISGYQISGNTILRTAINDKNSVFIGNCAGTYGGTGLYNIGIGCKTLYNNTSGCDNIAIGVYSLCANIIGCNNVGVGYGILSNNTIGSNNVGVGYYSLHNNICGTDNVAIGNVVLNSNTIGCYNIAIGYETLSTNNCGNNNIALGYITLNSNTYGCYNIAIGSTALINNTTGCENIAVGFQALFDNTIGCHNVGIGEYSLFANSSGHCNVAMGYRAIPFNISGCNNIGIGIYALNCNVGGCYNVAIGRHAGYYETGTSKLHIANCCSCSLIYGEFDNKLIKICGSLYTTTIPTGMTSMCNVVWDDITYQFKQTTNPSILLSYSITGATNGLTKSGKNVLLGGPATGWCMTFSPNTYQKICYCCANSSTSNADTFISTNDTYCYSEICQTVYDIYLNTDYCNCNSFMNVCPLSLELNSASGSTRTSLCITNNNDIVIKSDKSGFKGVKYYADYSANYTSRSLVDKEYVTGLTSNINKYTITGVSTSVTLTNKQYVVLVNTTSPVTITLPSTPKQGQAYKIKDATNNALINNIIICGNGINMDGNSNIFINSDYGAFEVVYDCTFNLWFTLSFIN